MDYMEFEPRNIFGLGKENTAFAQYFTGKSYLNPLTPPPGACRLLRTLRSNPDAAITGTRTARNRMRRAPSGVLFACIVT